MLDTKAIKPVFYLLLWCVFIMYLIRFIVFIEILTLIVGGFVHLACYFGGKEFPLIMYPIVCGVVLLAIIFVIFIVAPLYEWLLG